MEEINIDELNVEWLELDFLPYIIKKDTEFVYFKSVSGKYYKMDGFDALKCYASSNGSYLLIIETNIVDGMISYHEGYINKIAKI